MHKNKTSTTIALILMTAMVVSIVALPAATAQEPIRANYAYIGAVPNPVGVGQEVLLHIGVMAQLTSVEMGWEGLSVTIERPDGVTETLRDIRTDSTGGTGRVYVPTMAGNYTFQTHFPEQVIEPGKTAPGSPMGTRMLANSSPKLTLVVQDEPVPVWPGLPLPTEYWTRPIDAQLHEWAGISGNWETNPANRYARFNDDAPETAHILWTKQLAAGGLAGGLIGRDNLPHSYECGDAYVGKFGTGFPGFYTPVIINGVLYYNRFEERGQPYAGDVDVVAVDLHTGEELWCKPLIGRTGTTTGRTVSAANRMIDGVSEQFPDGIGRRLSFGQVFYWDSHNYHGVYGFLWTVTGSTWMAFDVLTGRWVYTITNVPSGTILRGPCGELLIIQVNLGAGWAALWNSTKMGNPDTAGFGAGSWNPHGNVYNASGTGTQVAAAWEWNITIPTGLPGSAYLYKLEDKIVGSYMDFQTAYFGGEMGVSEIVSWGISLEPGREGSLLYNVTTKAPAEWAQGNQSISRVAGSIDDGLVAYWSKEGLQHWGFSTETGRMLWGPTEPQDYLDHYGHSANIAYGRYFSVGMSGVLHCYNATTGELLWTYEADDPYNQVLWTNQWHLRPLFVADGKFYLGTSEHSPIDPKPKGAAFVCVDIETGEEVFRADGLFRQTDWGGRAIIGDSIIATMDTYDQRIYAIGKGPSAITATIQNDVTTHGNKVLVTGTVTDVSPGTRGADLVMRFPNGVPAVADECMSEWMLYVYKQFPRPADVVGVEVVVRVLDPNNNYYEVGRTTANDNGFFKLLFEPEVPGEYSVIVAFEGSKAYYGSFAETAMYVEEAPSAPSEPTPPPESVADVYLLPGIIGIIIAIVVVGAVIVLMQRKR